MVNSGEVEESKAMANIPSQLRTETPGPKTHLLHKHWHVLNTAGPPHSHTTHANFLCTSSPHKLLGTHQLQHSQDRVHSEYKSCVSTPGTERGNKSNATSAMGRSAWVTTAAPTAHLLGRIQDSELHTPCFKK